jgi:hypothetical protein
MGTGTHFDGYGVNQDLANLNRGIGQTRQLGFLLHDELSSLGLASRCMDGSRAEARVLLC